MRWRRSFSPSNPPTRSDMKTPVSRILLAAVLGWMVMISTPTCLDAQYYPPAFTGPDATRNSLNALRNQINWFQNTTQTARNLTTSGYSELWQQFQALQTAFATFQGTLSPAQLQTGANDMAELASGLQIIQEAFTDNQAEANGGLSSPDSLLNLCQVLNRAVAYWTQQLQRDCSKMGIAWY